MTSQEQKAFEQRQMDLAKKLKERTTAKILADLKDGRGDQAVASKMASEIAPRLDRVRPWRDPRLKCMSKRKLLSSGKPKCESNPANGKICTDSPGKFLSAAGIASTSIAPPGNFELRLRTYRKPSLQGPTDACVAFSMENELSTQMDHQAIFSELVPSFNGFQIYNQLSNSPASRCIHSTDQDDFTTAQKQTRGLDVDKSLSRALSDPICLSDNPGRIRPTKAISYTGTDVDLNVFYSLIQSSQGAMIATTTEVGLEQEDWVQYGCAGTPHMIYLSGVGRGTNPFKGKMEEYAIVRDSFRDNAREYKVSLENLKSVMLGIFKLTDLKYIAAGTTTSNPENSTLRGVQ